MTIEELLNRLEADKNEAERVRKECHLKAKAAAVELREEFEHSGAIDKGLQNKIEQFGAREQAACCEINTIVTTIKEIKRRVS